MTTKTITMPQKDFTDRLGRAAKFAAKPAAMLQRLEAVQMRVVGPFITFTATDRYKAATFRIEQPVEYGEDRKPIEAKPHPVPFTVDFPAAVVSQLVKMLPTTRRYANALVTVSVERGILTVTNDDGVRFSTPENDEFTDLKKIWGSMRSAITVEASGAFDPKLMSEALAAMAEKNGVVTYWRSTDNGPMAFRSNIGIALIMPKKFDSGVEVEGGLVDGWGEALGLDS